MAKKGKVLQTVIDIAGEISPTLGKSINGVADKLDGLNVKAVAFSAAAAAAVGGAAIAFGKATSYLTDLGGEYDAAANSMAASTGLVGDKLEALEEVMRAVYNNQYGETMQEAADGVEEVYRQTKLMGDALQATTEGAFALQETFGYDIAESARAAKAMMTNFGISGEDAMGMIAAGAQNGLDYSGELIDSISEYSVQFAKLGFSADDMFHIFQQGAENGAWNLDKVGDAIKEFSIRSIDGSKGTQEAFAALGFSGKEAMSIFAEGGEDAEYAFQIVLKELIAMEDQVKRDEVGVALFGTMWEDLGVDAVSSMIDVQVGLYDTADALGKINAVKYDSLDAAMDGIRRQVEVSLLPAAESVSDAFIDIAPNIEQMVIAATPYITELAGYIGPAITAVANFPSTVGEFMDKAAEKYQQMNAWMEDHADLVRTIAILTGTLTAAVVAYNTAQAIKNAGGIVEIAQLAALQVGLWGLEAAQVAQTAVTWLATTATTAWGAAVAFLTSPITLVILAIGALVAAGVWLYNNWDLVKEKAAQLGQFLGGVWEGISSAVGGFLTGIKDGFYNAFSALAGIVKGPINAVISIVNGAIDGINSIGFEIPDWVPFVGGEKFDLDIPKLPMLATGGHTDGISIAGEAGMETVISYDPAYRAENLSYWAEAGRMLGADWSDFTLGGGSNGDYYDFSGITFAPQITVQGNADPDDIMDKLEAAYPEFLDFLERKMAERRATAYA